MKNFLASCLLPIMLSTCAVAPVMAQGTRCIPTGDAYASFEAVGAIPIFNGVFAQGVLEIWAEHDEDGPSWVAFITFPDGRSCLLTEGTIFDVNTLLPNV